MGRQPFLTRLAFGRSPLEPSESITQSTEYVQLESSQQEIPQAVRESNPNRYIQLFDERGSPINPRAHEHGRQFRQAQNDVLSAIGVVERRPSPSDDLPGAYRERLEQLESEDSWGNALALGSTLSENLCTWWIGSLRDRVLTFRTRDTVPFSQIVASEFRNSGISLIHSGFPARLLSTVTVQASFYAAYVMRPLDRILAATHASRRTRYFFQRRKDVMRSCFRIFVEVLFYPFAYHANLQRLGMLPARPLLPSWKAFIPFSTWSPIRPISFPSSLSTSTLSDVSRAILTSPLVFVCIEHFMERWVYAVIYEAIETSIICPDNPDLVGPDDGAKNRATAILGLHTRSPSIARKGINRLLVALGWAEALPANDFAECRRSSEENTMNEACHTVEVNGTQVTNINRLPITTAHSGIQPVSGFAGVIDTSVTSHTAPPMSPTASEPSQHGDDPRIRITSREGIVEMEVRLPSQVISSHTEVAGFAPPVLNEHNAVSPGPEPPVPQTLHRVTDLSTTPAHMIGAVCKAQIVGWATLPLKLVTFRLIALHYLSGRKDSLGVHQGRSSYHVLNPLAELHDLNMRSAGLLVSRVALCGILEVAIDLTLWGCQYLAVVSLGRNYYGWGVL